MANRSLSSWVGNRSSSNPFSFEKDITFVSQFTHRVNGFSLFFSSMVSITAGGDIGTDGVGHIIDGHGLQPHAAGAGEDGVEQALAAKEDVLGALSMWTLGSKPATLPVSTTML